MKDKTARVLAIIALVFMAIFVVTLTMTVIDYRMLHGSIGYLSLTSGVFVFVIFLALKAEGRGFSMTKINNDIEMAKIEKELAEKEAAEKALAEKEEKAQSDEDTQAQANVQPNVDVKTDETENSDGRKGESAQGAEDETSKQGDKAEQAEKPQDGAKTELQK